MYIVRHSRVVALRASGDKTMDFSFPDFPDQESGKPDFQHVHVNQLSKSFKMRGHMIFFRFSGFSGFPDPESGNPDFSLSRRDPGVKPDPTVPHL